MLSILTTAIMIIVAVWEIDLAEIGPGRVPA